jgi:signal peptidase I
MKDRPAKTKRWAKPAILWSLLVPGLGHVAVGYPARGIALSLLLTATYLGQIYLKTIYTPAGLFFLILSSIAIYGYIVFDAGQLSSCEPKKNKRWFMRLDSLIAFAVLSCLSSLFFDSLQFIPAERRMPSSSMSDTILVDDHFLIDLTAYESGEPAYNDVVAFLFPEDETKLFIKRIIAKPGDLVAIKNKQVFVNGSPIGDSHARHGDTAFQARRDSMPAMTVAPDTYFVLGDNRDESYDSRFFGTIPKNKILGRARIILWSDTLSRIGNTL